MLYELRFDTLWPGKIADFIELCATRGVPLRGEKYGRLEGFWRTDVGPQNQAVHLWSHADFAARQDARVRMAEDHTWQAEFGARIEPLMFRQEIRLMTAVSPLRPPEARGGIYEFRRSVTRPLKVGDWTRRLMAALPMLERHARNVAVLHTMAGRPNEVFSIWWHESDAARQRARTGDATSRSAAAELDALLLEDDTMLLTPTPFSPLP